MEITYTYSIESKHPSTNTVVIEISRKVFDSEELLSCHTVYGVEIKGNLGSFHQGQLKDYYLAKEREIDQAYKHSVIDALNANADLCAVASM